MGRAGLVLASWLLLALGACGGGGSSGSGGGNPLPGPPAPSALSYPGPQVYTRGAAIAALNPTITGSPTSYSISPALPAGLAINVTSGSITGTPGTLQAATTYTVTAGNAAGSTSATLSLTVNDLPPDITYQGGAWVFELGVPIAALQPTNSGGAVVSWSLNRSLPSGLSFDTTNGSISGTSSAAGGASRVVVTAQNSGGADTFDLSIAIQDNSAAHVVLDLGHTSSLFSLQHSGPRILSMDDSARAVLWNGQTGEKLFTAAVWRDASCGVSCGAPHALLAGPTMLLRTSTGWNLRSSTDGSLTGGIASGISSTAMLASDGSYALVRQSSGFSVFSPTGTLLTSRSSGYGSAQFFAAPGEIRIAGGPAGAQVIEYLTPAGTATQSPTFAGTFHSWFADGSSFLTITGSTVRVYSSAATSLDLSALPSVEGLAGRGNWFWTKAGGTLSLYRVGASATPAQSYSVGSLDRLVSSSETLALLPYGAPSLIVIDLAGATPSRTDHATPIAYLQAFAAASSTDWVFGNRDGAMFGEMDAGSEQLYSEGRVRAFAGSSSRAALATSAGRIHLFNGTTRAAEGTIDFSSSQLDLSADGSVLAARANDDDAQYQDDRSIRVYALSPRSLLKEWQASFAGGNWPLDFSLSAQGDAVAQSLGTWTGSSWTITRRVTRLNDTLLWTDTRTSLPSAAPMALRINADATRVAAADNLPGSSTATNIYTNGVLTGATAGSPAGWLDDTRLLVNRFTGATGNGVFAGADIVDASGVVQSSPPLPRLDRFQRLGSGTVYSPDLNVIVDVETGSTLWSSASPASGSNGAVKGAVAGGYVFFASGPTVRAEPR